MSTPFDLGWGDPRRGGFAVVSFDIGEGVHLAVRNADVGEVFAELVRRLMAAGWDGPADPVRDDWGYNPRLKRWAEAAGYTKATAPLSAWSDHSWATAIDLDTIPNPMLAGRPADPWAHTNLPRSSSAIADALGLEWGGDWSEPWDPQHFQIAMTPAKTRQVADRIRAQGAPTEEDPLSALTDQQQLGLVADLQAVKAAVAKLDRRTNYQTALERYALVRLGMRPPTYDGRSETGYDGPAGVEALQDEVLRRITAELDARAPAAG